LEPVEAGIHSAHDWEYEVTARCEGALFGTLTYRGRAIAGGRPGDRILTPWGLFCCCAGPTGVGFTPFGPHCEQESASSLPGRLLSHRPCLLNLSGFGVQSEGDWRYAYSVASFGGPREQRCGRLFYKGRDVVSDVGDIIETPWGFMAHCQDDRNMGWLPERAGAEPIDLSAGNMVQLPG
jgi:hypothetical protein